MMTERQNNSLTTEPNTHPATATPHQEIESFALKSTLFASAIAAIGSLLYTINYTTIPIVGQFSLAGSILTVCILLPFFLFQIGYAHGIKVRFNIHTIHWRQRLYALSLGIAYTIFYAGLALLLVLFLENAFKGLQLDTLTAAAITAVVAAVTAYSAAQLSANIDSMAIIHTLLIFLVTGICSSMILNNDPLWWQNNFSYLGGLESNTSLLFNFTLILSGMLLLALTDFLFHDLRSAIPGKTGQVPNFTIIRYFFVATAICLALVGAFPFVDQSIVGQIHNLAAGGLVVSFLIIIFFIQLILPGLSRSFYITSYGFGLILLVLYVGLYRYYNYLSLTAFELLAFLVCFIWLYILLKNIIARKLDHDSPTPPDVPRP